MTQDNGASGPPLWRNYVCASALLALSGGFMLGGLLLLLRAIGARGAVWQAAAAQAHGHLQLFGWGGLMVLGVGLHFLPRLVSVPLTQPRLVRPALWLLVAGLVLRATCQPALSDGLPVTVRDLAALGLTLGATLELGGATLILVLILGLGRGMQRAVKKRIAPAVIGLIALAFVSFWLAIFTGWLGAINAAVDRDALIAPRLDNASVLPGLLGFLVPVSLAMSARLFPLYATTQLPDNRLLGLGAVMLAIGLVARLGGDLTQLDLLAGIGQLFQAVGISIAIRALRVFERRRTLPRREVRVLSDPLQLHLVSAYAWLGFAAVLLWFDGIDQLGLGLWQPVLDAQRHALGAGFVTLLIFGVGSEMLPGFAQSPLRRPRLRWATLVLGNLAALLRIAPLLLSAPLSVRGSDAVMSVAGLLGALAIAVFLATIPLFKAGRPGRT